VAGKMPECPSGMFRVGSSLVDVTIWLISLSSTNLWAPWGQRGCLFISLPAPPIITLKLSTLWVNTRYSIKICQSYRKASFSWAAVLPLPLPSSASSSPSSFYSGLLDRDFLSQLEILALLQPWPQLSCLSVSSTSLGLTIWGAQGKSTKGRPTYHMSKYLKVILHSASRMGNKICFITCPWQTCFYPGKTAKYSRPLASTGLWFQGDCHGRKPTCAQGVQNAVLYCGYLIIFPHNTTQLPLKTCCLSTNLKCSLYHFN
jgi:hypothetical protein